MSPHGALSERPVKGPKRSGNPFGFKPDPNAVELVVIGDGRNISIPATWWDRQRPAYNLSGTDLTQFAKWLGDKVRADGGTVDDHGNRWRWLDQELAKWREDLAYGRERAERYAHSAKVLAEIRKLGQP